MIELEENELKDIQMLVNLKSIDKTQVKLMESYIRLYIDHKAHVCGHCHAQIKFAHTRLVGWYNNVIKPNLKSNKNRRKS